MREGNSMHRFNQHLLAGFGLLVVVIVAGFYFSEHFKQVVVQKPASTQSKTLAEQATTNNLGGYDQASLDQIKPVRPISPADHLLGDLSSPVQIIIYDDFSAAYSAQYQQVVEQVRQAYAGQVTIAFRQFPIASIHPIAELAAEASECAAEQDKFWEIYQQLFIDNRAGQLSAEQFKQDAIKLGLDQAKFNQCLDQGKYKPQVLAQIDEAKTFGVTGTPTTFINGRIIIGANPFLDATSSDGQKIEGLKTIIDKLLKK